MVVRNIARHFNATRAAISKPRGAVMNSQFRQFTVQPGQGGHFTKTTPFQNDALAKKQMSDHDKKLAMYMLVGAAAYGYRSFIKYDELMKEAGTDTAQEYKRERARAMAERDAFIEVMQGAVERAKTDEGLRLYVLSLIDAALKSEKELEKLHGEAYARALEKKKQMAEENVPRK